MVYADGTPAFSGQVQFSAVNGIFIEITSSQPPRASPGASQTITQGVNPAEYRLNNVNNPPPTPAVPYCYSVFIGTQVYLTCGSNPFTSPCAVMPFASNYLLLSPRTGLQPLGRFEFSSLDADTNNPQRFVFSAVGYDTSQPMGSVVQYSLVIVEFKRSPDGYYRPSPPVVIQLGSTIGVAMAPSSVVDFDAEISAAGTWMAIVGLRASAVEPFPWSYRVLSFATFPPTLTYQITSARILVTSIDLDTNGESAPFGAAKLTKRGNVNYATIAIGSAALDGRTFKQTAGVPIVFRSVDDAFTQVYAAFPSPYHAITSGAVVLWPHQVSDDVSILSVPAWRQGFDSPNIVTWGDYPTLTRYTNGFLSPNAQLCNATVAGKFYTVSSRTYACVELITQDAIWTRSGIFTWAPVGTLGMRHHFARPNDRAACA